MPRSTRFFDACAGRAPDCTPVWLMRQAGRYQASYQSLRRKYSFVELCKTPELVARVTLSPVYELGVDAAILFSDILLPLEAMGAPLSFTDAGPVLHQPLRTVADVEALTVPDPHTRTPYIAEAVRATRRALDGVVPLIGFAGAPLTLASYLLEGGNSKTYNNLRKMIFGEPALAEALLDKLAHTVTLQLLAQIEAGCQAVQLFDSWGGILSADDYARFGLPFVARIFEAVKHHDVPRILFGTGTEHLLELLGHSGAEVIGIDWRTDLALARERLGPDKVLQGNLDPGYLFLEREGLEAKVAEVLDKAGDGARHIFNLGHGVLPNTDEERVRDLVDAVHKLSRSEGIGL